MKYICERILCMRIIIVDDDNLVSLSLKTILEASGEIEVLDIGRNGEEAIVLFEKYKPDVLLMDIRMTTMSGLEAAKEILSKHPQGKILFLTTFSDDEYIIQALSLGAKGYILKQDFDSILPALKAVYSGQNVYGSNIVEKLPTLMQNPTRKFDYEKHGITPKEMELIVLVSKGLNNKEISEQLYLSEGTIRNYLSSILEKLQLRDRTQLAIFYLNNT